MTGTAPVVPLDRLTRASHVLGVEATGLTAVATGTTPLAEAVAATIRAARTGTPARRSATLATCWAAALGLREQADDPLVAAALGWTADALSRVCAALGTDADAGLVTAWTTAENILYGQGLLPALPAPAAGPLRPTISTSNYTASTGTGPLVLPDVTGCAPAGSSWCPSCVQPVDSDGDHAPGWPGGRTRPCTSTAHPVGWADLPAAPMHLTCVLCGTSGRPAEQAVLAVATPLPGLPAGDLVACDACARRIARARRSPTHAAALARRVEVAARRAAARPDGPHPTGPALTWPARHAARVLAGTVGPARALAGCTTAAA